MKPRAKTPAPSSTTVKSTTRFEAEAENTPMKKKGEASVREAAKTEQRITTTKPASKAAPATTPQPTHEEISRRAHEIWEREGRPEGRQVEHWLTAEAELRRKG